MTAEQDSVRRLLRLLATAGAALVLLVIVSSAFLRLTQAGLSCADWPACYGRVGAEAQVTDGQRIARLAHRLAATAVAAILIALSLIAWTQRPPLVRQGAIVIACLGIVIGLAILGIATPGTRLPAVTLANFGGGYALLGLLWWMRLTVERPRPARADFPAMFTVVAAIALLAAITQIALGALVSAKFAALSCPAFPDCGATWPSGSLRTSMDLFEPLSTGSDDAITRPAALAALHWAHRVGAVVVAALVAVVAAYVARSRTLGPELGLILLGLVVSQIALGAASVLTHLPLVLVLAHNLIAALLLVALVTLNCRVSAGERSV
jgi:cytochrome c oxidase assembly protein subunit 15